MIPKAKAPFTLTELFSVLVSRNADAEERFECRFSEAFGFPYGLFFNYGRSCLYALLVTLGLKEEEIVVPAYTCVVVPNAIVLAGNKVRFADNPHNHFNVSSDTLSEALHASVKMVVPSPLLGYPIDRKGYEKIIAEKAPHAFVLYDTAQGYGTEDQYGLQTSTADGAFVGLGEGKVLSTLFGGMLLLRDRKVYEAVKAFRNREFRSPRFGTFLPKVFYGMGYWAAFREPFVRVFDFLESKTGVLNGLKNDPSSGPSLPRDALDRPIRLQAAMGLTQLDRYEHILEKRREIAKMYEQELSENDFSIFSSAWTPVYSHFPLITNNRNRTLRALRKYGVVASFPFRSACPELRGYEEHKGKYPNASSVAKRLITLPNWPGMRSSHIQKVVQALVRCRGENPALFLDRSPSSMGDGLPDNTLSQEGAVQESH